MRYGSLFSGVGGFDLGLDAAGMECAWQVECDEQAQAVLRHHWPEANLYKDVCDVGGIPLDESALLGRDMGGQSTRLEGGDGGRHQQQRSNRMDTGGTDAGRTALAPVDLICGGFPCQDLSVAGKRSGLDGERSGLFYEFMRIVGEISPEFVLIENVPGLLSSNGGRDMGAVLGTLGDLGYGWTYRVLDTQYFGPPQRRKRVFIVGRAGGYCPPEVLLEREGVPWNPAPKREARKGAAEGVTRCLSSGQHNAELTDDHAPTLNLNHDGAPIAFNWQSGGDVRQNPSTTGTDALTCHQTPAVAYQDRTRPRRLTPRECERLQGWPDDHTRWGTTPDGEVIEMADTPRYRFCGNGVSAPVSEWIGRRILAHNAPSGDIRGD